MLTSHLENKILPYDESLQKNEEMVKAMNQVTESLKALKESQSRKTNDNEIQKEEKIAALGTNFGQQSRPVEYPPNNYSTRNYSRRYENPQMDRNRNVSRPFWRRNRDENTSVNAKQSPYDKNHRNSNATHENRILPSNYNYEALEDVIQQYDKQFGKVPSPCRYCNGHHFHIHCPLRNLKALRAPGKEATGRP